jgi:RHS repeat-associated protein
MSRDLVNYAEGAPIQCSNLTPYHCIRVNDGDRGTHGQTSGYYSDNTAAVDIILPPDSYITELYWKIRLWIDWGGGQGRLQIWENGAWQTLSQVNLGLGAIWAETVALDPPRPITRARIWASRGDYSPFGNVYHFFELEVWGYHEGPLPEDYFYGLPRYIGFDADPVNTATGNFTHEETDLCIAAHAFPLAFKRSYNSKDERGGPLSPGWTHSFHIVLTELEPGGQVAVRWGDARTDYWDNDGGDNYVPSYPGCYDELIRYPDETWTVTKKDLSVYRFDVVGRLTSMADKNGNTVTLAYEDADFPEFVTEVTDAVGRSLTLVYTEDGLLDSVSDFASPSRTVQYSYTGGRLSEVTDMLGNTVQYTYTGNDQLETIIDQRGITIVTNVYDGEGRVIEQQDGNDNVTVFQYDTPEANRTTVIDTVTVGDEFQVLQTIHTHGGRHKLLLSVENPLGHTVTYDYDDSSNRTSITDRNGNTTEFTYDDRGNVTSTSEPDDPDDPNDGGVTSMEYSHPDFPDLPTRTTDALGYVTEWTYDGYGNVLGETCYLNHALTDSVTRSWTYNQLGEWLTATDERGNVREWIYAEDGLPQYEVGAAGDTTWHGYDELWRRIWVTDCRGNGPEDVDHTTYYTYDDADRVNEVTGPPVGDPPYCITRTFEHDEIGNLTHATDGNGNTTASTYDPNSNVTRVEEPLDGNPQGRITEYVYDELDRKVALVNANGDTTSYRYDPADRLEWTEDAEGNQRGYAYDPHGNILTETDASGVALSYEYDALHRKTRVQDELENEWTLEYDKLGRGTRKGDATGNETQYAYDALGRLVAAVDAAGGVTQYTYDAVGNLASIKDAKDQLVSIREHDAENRLTKATDADGCVYEYGYDEVGNRIWVTDAKGETDSLRYDAENRTIAIVFADGTRAGYTYDGNRNLLDASHPDAETASVFTYDERSRLRSSTDPLGQVVGHAYDALGNRTMLTYPDERVVAYAHDRASRLRTITDWDDRVTEYTYDGFRIATALFPNGVTETWAYDGAGRVTSLETRNSADSLLITFAWIRDGDGNPLAVTETGTLQPTLEQESLQNYRYDADNRLQSVAHIDLSPQNPVQSGPAGNTRDAINTYVHDANGNLTQRIIGGATTLFAYDSRELLISQRTGLHLVEHVYDAMGNRICRVEDGLESRFVLDLARRMSQVLCETDESGTITAYYIHGPRLVARIGADGSERYYHTNDLGTVVALTDETEGVADRYAYSPFGTLTVHEGATANPFTYVGGLGVMAEADGLYFMRARFYDPPAGRFLGKDPLQGSVDDPQTLHRYVYGLNAPVAYVDPSGEINWSKAFEYISKGKEAYDEVQDLLVLAEEVDEFLGAVEEGPLAFAEYIYKFGKRTSGEHAGWRQSLLLWSAKMKVSGHPFMAAWAGVAGEAVSAWEVYILAWDLAVRPLQQIQARSYVPMKEDETYLEAMMRGMGSGNIVGYTWVVSMEAMELGLEGREISDYVIRDIYRYSSLNLRLYGIE